MSQLMPAVVMLSPANQPMFRLVSERRPMPIAAFLPASEKPPEQYGGSVTTASTPESVGSTSRQSARYSVASPIRSHLMGRHQLAVRAACRRPVLGRREQILAPLAQPLHHAPHRLPRLGVDRPGLHLVLRQRTLH